MSYKDEITNEEVEPLNEQMLKIAFLQKQGLLCRVLKCPADDRFLKPEMNRVTPNFLFKNYQ